MPTKTLQPVDISDPSITESFMIGFDIPNSLLDIT